ncbi:hypothetical protein [Leptospira kanakyensis]|uniref:Uncharacterized protein n=1 Tax=Leptospira kanakyensis TaxID=2484968 RepID=A0A6N4QK27_9LEPT|nr:hypothetical protein [Leptospira kanakyensis]TGK53504.1 hypothetical protein EHQ11_03925 [Leptospira kanakyensis]TGK73010.1 hypothetical protein EHQ18_04000 [Leptospira kanakyensis]
MNQKCKSSKRSTNFYPTIYKREFNAGEGKRNVGKLNTHCTLVGDLSALGLVTTLYSNDIIIYLYSMNWENGKIRQGCSIKNNPNRMQIIGKSIDIGNLVGRMKNFADDRKWKL